MINAPGNAPFELITNDVLKITLKPMLGWSDYSALARVSKTFQKRIQPLFDAEWNKILKAITFGKDKWLNIPGVVTVSDEPPFTEEQEKRIKAKFRGICQIFNESDPMRPHRFQNDRIKRTWDTHVLMFFPEFINSTPRTFYVIGKLFHFERKIFEWMPDADEARNQGNSGSYWRFVPRDVFPGSRRATDAQNMEIVKSKGCMVPSLCDAATAIPILGSERSFGAYTITDEKYCGGRLIIGAAAPYQLIVLVSQSVSADVGIAGFTDL